MAKLAVRGFDMLKPSVARLQVSTKRGLCYGLRSMVPSNLPALIPVGRFKVLLSMKVPGAAAKRPVPPVMV